MSGGTFGYVNERVAHEMKGRWEDEEINELFYDLFCAPLWGSREGGLATALDFWQACDVDEEDYREYVAKFKAKWFGRTPEDRAEFYAGKLQERCDELKAEIVRDFDFKIGGTE